MKDQLEEFRVNWQGIHVNVEETFMTYTVVTGFSKSASYRAMALIATLNLDLIAEPTGEDTFIIRYNGK
jgi:hypothetical protein